MNIYKVSIPIPAPRAPLLPPHPGGQGASAEGGHPPARRPWALQPHRKPRGARGCRGAAAIAAPGTGQVLS